MAELTEDQKHMQDMTKKFVREEVIPKAAYHDKTGEYPWEIITKAWELGLCNGHIPQSVGEWGGEHAYHNQWVSVGGG